MSALNQKSYFSAISVSGSSMFLTSPNTLQLQVSPSGAQSLLTDERSFAGLPSSTISPLVKEFLKTQSSGMFDQEFQIVNSRSLMINEELKRVLPQARLNSTFSPTPIAGQLKMIARLMSLRNILGVQRQIFFVQLGGWDMHDNLKTQFPDRIKMLADALNEFDLALHELGIQNDVLTFTASDFGRNLTSNGDGSDHGWGGHHFIIGPLGEKLYGSYPPIGLRTNWDVRSGALLPTTSVDQLAVAVGGFLGIDQSTLMSLIPNAKYFDPLIL